MDKRSENKIPAAAETGTKFPVVGMGASAGGLEPLRQLLGALPLDTGMAFVIVQHLSPDRESGLTEILSRATRLSVCEVDEDCGEPAVEPNHVYVIPPARDMVIVDGKLQLFVQDRRPLHRGIDQFFRSLAEDSGHLAIGVVLSGCASDGTLGLEEIKAAGGFTFAQDDTAQQNSMPRSAVASGCVDFVLPPEGIARELARIAKHPYVAANDEPEDAGAPGHARIAEIVRRAMGVDFTHYKSNTLRRRINRRMMLHRLETPRDYEEYLRRTPAEIEALYQDILIGVTSFFRNPDAFDALASEVFPKLIAACPPGEPVRLWTVGCASGEEAYSLAMVFAECADAAESAARLQLFGTDVNAAAIEKARAGLYPRSIANDVSPERLQRFFVEEGGGYRIRKTIRERCVFSRHNVLADPPFSRVDFISCRNLLIYLEPTLQQRIVPLFHYALKPDGWLWLGSSESVGAGRATLFEVTDARQKIFTRRPGGRTPAARTPLRPAGHFPIEPGMARPVVHSGLPRDAERLLLAKYAPPGVVVSATLEIVQFQGDTGPYLAPASGAANHDLLKMLREGLPAGVRDAIQRAEKEGDVVRAEGLRVRSNGGFRELAVEVIPIKADAPGRGAGFIVLFDAERKPTKAVTPPKEKRKLFGKWWRRLPGGNAEASPDPRDEEIAHLTRELATARETLQATTEQSEAANEELQSANEEAQSANEEMQSINEELETSKEEIEASNEELTVLMDELASRNAELNRLNDELRGSRDYAESLVASVRVPLVVLDAGLRVQTVSRAFCEDFRVTSAETVGRLIYDLGNRQWDIPVLRTLLEDVLPRENTIEGFEVRHAFEQIGPRIMLLNARRLEQTAGGEPLIVLSIEDITDRTQAADVLAESEARYRSLFETIDEGFCVIEMLFDADERPMDYRFLQVSPSFERQSGIANALGRTMLEIAPGHEAHWFEKYGEVALTGESVRFENYAAELERWFDVHATRFGAPDKRQVAVLFDDVTERKRNEEALRQNETLFSKLIDQAPGGVYVVDDAFRMFQMNSRARPTFAAAEPLIGRDFVEVMHILWGPEVGPSIADVFRHTLETGEPYVSFRFTDRRHDIDVEKTYDWETQRVTLPSGRHGVVCYFTDTTEQRALEDALRVSEQRAVGIIQSIADGFITMDAEWRITYLSPRGAEILAPLQKTTENVLGKVFWDEFPGTLDTVIEENYLRAHREQVPVHFESYYLPLDRWFDIRAYPSTLSVTIYFLDITDRKITEMALAEQRAALLAADRSKDEFLAMLAHELRNPLAPLRTAAELLRTPRASDEERAEAQRILARQIENMSRMIDDLLDVSRITEGKIQLHRDRVALADVLTSAVNVARSECVAHRQSLTISLPEEPIYLDADATRLDQVFGNLLGNACKYSGTGSHIALRAELAPGTEPPEVIIRVSDDGVGIAPELLPRIFDLFVQASRTLDRAHGGLGIGLTLVHRLVKLHGGSVEARSEGVGRGTEFLVRLPIASSSSLSPPPKARAQSDTEVPCRMLIVDDNQDSANVIAMLQRLRGHETRTAFTGPDALALAAEFLPEVVLLDIGLPGMDGFEVARQLRAIPALAGTFLIAMTGYGSQEDRTNAMAAGFDRHLVKPLSPDQLEECLRGRL